MPGLFASSSTDSFRRITTGRGWSSWQLCRAHNPKRSQVQVLPPQPQHSRPVQKAGHRRFFFLPDPQSGLFTAEFSQWAADFPDDAARPWLAASAAFALLGLLFETLFRLFGGVLAFSSVTSPAGVRQIEADRPLSISLQVTGRWCGCAWPERSDFLLTSGSWGENRLSIPMASGLKLRKNVEAGLQIPSRHADRQFSGGGFCGS